MDQYYACYKDLCFSQNEWPINDDFCNYTASTWILATKKKSEGKDDENW